MKKQFLFLLLSICLISFAGATLEGAAFGFGKDMGMSYLSSQNPAIGQAISFAMCPQCAVTGQAMSALNEVAPGSAELINGLQNPTAFALGKAKQEVMSEVVSKLSPEERTILSNIEKYKPYIEEAFEVNPKAEEGKQKGSIEIDDDGNTIIKDGEGNVFANIPSGYEAIESEGSFGLINKNAKADSVLEIKSHKIRLDRNSVISFSEKDGVQFMDIESGDVNIGGTKLLGVQNASIRSDENDQIQFADFTSKDGGSYNFSYNNKDYDFTSKPGGKILFNPEENILEGSNGALEIGGKRVESNFFSAKLDDNGRLDELEISPGGKFYDNNGHSYSSIQKFKVFYNGKSVEDYDGNGISVLEGNGVLQFNAKGIVEISNGLDYRGLNKEVYTKYNAKDNLFDIKNGDAVIDNYKHKMIVRDGELYLDVNNLTSDFEGAESFSIKYSEGDDELYGNINEKDGRLDILVFEDGKATSSNVVRLDAYEESIGRELGKDSPATIEESRELVEKLRSEDRNVEADILELNIVDSENMNSIGSGNVDVAIARLETFLSEDRAGDVKSMAELSVAELYATKAKSINVPKSYVLGESEGGDAKSSLFYRVEVVDGKEVVTGWSPDGVEYLSFDSGIVPKDYPEASKQFRGKYVTDENMAFLRKLKEDNSLSVLEGEALSRDGGLSVGYVKGTEEYREVLKNYEQTISYLKSSGEDKSLAMDSHFALAQTYGDMATLGESELWLLSKNEYLKVINSGEVEDADMSRAYLGIGNNYLSSHGNDPVLALKSFSKAYALDSENEIAKKAEIGLSDALLKSISSSLSKEELAIADDYLNKVGGEKRFTATGAPEVIMAAFGYHRSVGDISTGMMDKLNEENRGIVAIRGLYKKGLTNAEISEIVSKDNKNRLAELYDLPIDSEDEAVRDAAIGTLGRLRQSIRDGLKNEDVNLIVNDGNGQLGFLSGEGYSDEEYRRIIQRNWRDSVAGAVTIENIALFTLPVAKLSAASELMKAKELKEVASVAGWAGGVVMKVPGVAKVGQGIGSLKTTIGGYRAVQYTAKNFPTLTKIGSWVGSEAVESGAGSIVEKFVPGGGLPTEIILGHSQALDLGDSIFKNMKKEGLDVSSISVGKKMMTKDGKLYHSLEFDSKVDLEKFMKGEVGWYEQNSLGTSTKDVAKNINVGGVESVVFESDNGVNIVATVKGMNVNKIDGVKVVAKSDMGGIIEEVNLKSNQVSEFLSERRVSRVNPSLEEILESAEGALTTGDRNVKIMALKEINDASRSQASRMRGVSGEGSNVREVFVKSGIDEKRLKLINQLEGEKLGLEDRVILESARIGESPELIRGTLEDSFTLSTFETGGKLTEETYEKSVKRLAEEGRASAAMRGFETPEETRERVKQLFLLRAKQDGLSLNEIKTAENSFDSYYDSASKNTADVSEFAGRLSNLDSMFPDTTTVHLVRDGGLTGLAHKVASPDADVRLLYVSRDTLKDPLAVVGGESFNSVDVQKSLEVSSIYKKVDDLFEKGRQNFISEGKEDAFYKAYEEAFLKKTIEDPAFALSVENTYVQLKKAGLLDKKELRFVDTCCAGNMNFYLEAIVKHYNPEIKTSTLLMESTGISQFGSGLKGLNVERAHQRGVFGGFNSEGLPLIEKSATTTLSYVDELVVLESTINHMKKVDPDFLSEYVKGLGLVQKRDVVSQFAGAFVD